MGNRIRVIPVIILLWLSNIVFSQSKSIPTLDFQKIIERAKTKVFPTLVYIKPIRSEYSEGERKKQQVFGSGVIISADGYVVTNYHVVEKAIEIKCVLHDKKLLSGNLVGKDKDTDLALLKLISKSSNPLKLPYAEFGDSAKLEEGHFVMALGAPFGFTRSISLGIVSNAKRFIGGFSQYSLWIQTDAAINPGNSGGPLVNIKGKIVGIILKIGWGDNVGFAIPSNTVSKVVEHIKKYKKVKWAWIGISLQPLKDLHKNIFFEGEQGVIVANADKDSPAKRAGLLAGDRILKVNGRELNGLFHTDLPAIRWFLGELPLAKPALFEIHRGQEVKTIAIIPREKGKVEGEDFDCKRWDMTVKEINEFENPHLFFYRKNGVYVQGVRYPGNDSYNFPLDIDERPS